VVVAQDGPGFLVNRCGRPFGGESLRLLQERVATIEQIDRIVRMGGGFRMGPFELQDLVGIDVGFDVTKSFDAQSFGEPRWKPSMLQARMVAAGRLGRKTGRGWYSYEDGQPHRPDDPEPPEPGGGDGRRVEIEGSGPIADYLRERAAAAGFASEGDVSLVVDATVPAPVSDVGLAPEGAPLAALCADRSLASLGHPEAVGFHVLPGSRLVELTRGRESPEAAVRVVEDFFTACGFAREWVEDGPGLVLGRIVCQMVNEAAFAVGEGVGSPEDVDTGVTLGLNHPRGPVAWGRLLGFDHVLAAVDGLFAEYHDPRYRAAPLLRRGGIS
jgi:3-hydroxybutyryl-CoA dehydrogenase